MLPQARDEGHRKVGKRITARWGRGSPQGREEGRSKKIEDGRLKRGRGRRSERGSQTVKRVTRGMLGGMRVPTNLKSGKSLNKSILRKRVTKIVNEGGGLLTISKRERDLQITYLILVSNIPTKLSL